MAFNIAYTYQIIDKYTRPLEKIIAATRAHTRFLKENQEAIKASNATMTRMANRSERLNGSLKALEGNKAMHNLAMQARDLNEQVDKMNRARPRLPGGFGPGGGTGGAGGAAEGRLSRFGAAASGLSGLAIGAGATSVLRQTSAVEDAMIDLARATDLPATELKKFEERFMTLSEQIGISTDKLAIMAFEAAKSGIPTAELDRFVKITANSAVAFEVLEEEAGRALGSIKAKMGLSINSLEEMMDRINFVADATSADGANMINIVERLSGTFNLLKVPPAVAAGLAAIADQLETSPELAASGMNMVIREMMKSPAIAAKMVKAPAETIRETFTKLAKLPQAKQMAVAIGQFGDEAGRFAVKMASNMKLFDETMQKAAEAEAIGSMEREMKSRLGSLSMLWRNLKNAVMNVAVTIGEVLGPDIKAIGDKIRSVVPAIREFAKEHPGLVKFAAAGALILAAITLAVPVVMALGAAFSFVAAGVALLSAPIIAAIALVAGIAMKWGEWSAAGHPLVEVISSIIDRLGRIWDKLMGVNEATGASSKVMTALSAAFDVLGVVLAIPLQMLDQLLWALEKLIDLASKVSFENLAAGAKGLVSMIPGGGQAIAGLMDLAGIGGGEKSEVNGTITVRAEPGTKAKVEQPRLPTGNNVRLAGAR